MKIISSIDDDVWHALGGSSYEWWYFDAISSEGYGLVITFFCGLTFSPYYNRKIVLQSENVGVADPKDHAAFYLCLYGPRKTECYALNEYTRSYFEARRDRPEVLIDKCSLKYDSSNGFVIEVDAPARFGRRIEGRFVFKPVFSLSINESGLNGDHVWNCVAPRCTVEGRLSIAGILGSRALDFRGTGYHDHNYGVRPMHLDMRRWHWGRLHTPNETAIYYIIENENGEREGLLAVAGQDGRIIYCGPVKLESEETRHLMGLRYFSRMEIRSTEDGIELSITDMRAVDQGPFYLRFLAEQELSFDGNAAKKSRVIGFAEAFEPSKLFVKAYWPFVKMRIRRVT